MKERYRRISIGLTLSPDYEGLIAEARFVYLSLIISPRQTPPGIFDGTLKGLENETSLPMDRLKKALSDLQKSELVEPVEEGGWWVRETFRDQCCNPDYAASAIRHLEEKWPSILEKFREKNVGVLEKYSHKKKYPLVPIDLPQTPHTPPTDPHSSSYRIRKQIPETEADTPKKEDGEEMGEKGILLKTMREKPLKKEDALEEIITLYKKEKITMGEVSSLLREAGFSHKEITQLAPRILMSQKCP